MAKKEKEDGGGSKMIPPYVEKNVPARMKFPALAHVAVTKHGRIAVPTPDKYHRSWLLWQAVGDVDITQLEGERLKAFYNKVKIDAFSAKPFLHAAEPGDAEEEAQLSGLVDQWLANHPDKAPKASKSTKKTTADDDDDDDRNQVNESNKDAFLRGYPIAGWKIVSRNIGLFRIESSLKLHRLSKPGSPEDGIRSRGRGPNHRTRPAQMSSPMYPPPSRWVQC